MAGTFAANISRFCKKAEVDMRVVVRKIAFEAFKRVVLRTPVDTGRARANWSVTVGRAQTGFVTEGADKGASQTLRAALDGVNAWSTDGSIFLTNNLAYIGALEYGHSKQAPNGMVRVTVEEMQTWAANAVAKQSIGSIREDTGGH